MTFIYFNIIAIFFNNFNIVSFRKRKKEKKERKEIAIKIIFSPETKKQTLFWSTHFVT